MTVFRPDLPFNPKKAINDKDLLTFPVIEVSDGGIAIAATLESKDLFLHGQQVHDMRFKVRGLEIVADGIVMHTAQIASDTGKPVLKIGIQFHKLKPQYEKQIVQFVLDESRNQFSL